MSVVTFSLKRLNGWKSSITAERYIEDSIENKIEVARKVRNVNHVDPVNPVDINASTADPTVC